MSVCFVFCLFVGIEVRFICLFVCCTYKDKETETDTQTDRQTDERADRQRQREARGIAPGYINGLNKVLPVYASFFTRKRTKTKNSQGNQAGVDRTSILWTTSSGGSWRRGGEVTRLVSITGQPSAVSTTGQRSGWRHLGPEAYLFLVSGSRVHCESVWQVTSVILAFAQISFAVVIIKIYTALFAEYVHDLLFCKANAQN